MPRSHFGSRAVALACLLVASAAPALEAQASDIEALWKEKFRRPTLPPPSPGDNPLTPDKVALGAKLFFDMRLSGNGKRACASCHAPERQFTDGRRRALALSGKALRRNTSSLWNLAWGKHFFWDGRAQSLEAQVQMPVEEPEEMGGSWAEIVRRLDEDAELAGQFRIAFPEERTATQATVLKALASYVRSLVSPPTPFDAWIEGDALALKPAEVAGFHVFIGKAGCVLCHVGWRFTDDRFHDIGVAGSDGGRGAVPGGTPGLMAFKTPSLREVAKTAPYMHDGSLPTLEAVIAHYTGSFVRRPSLATHMNRDLRLTSKEKSDLIAFLRTLSSEKGPASARRAGPR